MDVTHPGSKPLDADQLSLLETFRGKVDSRLPGLCKDVLWSLMGEAKVANSNDFRRKDAITNTARRIPRVCAEPVMKKGKPKLRQA